MATVVTKLYNSVSKFGAILSPKGHLAMLGYIVVITLIFRATGIQWVKARDPLNIPHAQNHHPTTKNCLPQNANGQVEKP